MEPSLRGLVKSVTRTPKGRKEFAGTEKTANRMTMERAINKTRTIIITGRRRKRAPGTLVERVKRKRVVKQWGVGVPVGGVSKEWMEKGTRKWPGKGKAHHDTNATDVVRQVHYLLKPRSGGV